MMRLLPFLLVLAGCCAPHPLNDATEPKKPVVEVGTTASLPDYDRGDWGRWRDQDHDCQDTRQEVLIAEGTDLSFSDDMCKVISGTWICPLTGEVFHDPSKLDIDHMVPLKAAHDAGGWAWDKDRKSAYFNNLDQPYHLIAVSASANRSKGSRGPLEWMPTNKAFHCEYLRNWMRVKANWKLEVSCDESGAIAAMMAQACSN